MRGQIELLLERGIEAAEGGEQERARDTLTRVIELDQYNEKAWLWLGSVVETTIDKIVCLENVLVINPDNADASIGLQHLRRQPTELFPPPSTLPHLASPQTPTEEARGASAAKASLSPAQRVCSRCGFRNPGWAYLCDRCGADLRHVDLREAIGLGSRPRGRSFITLLQAWGGALIFSRLWAFLPEIELASWGRSLAALGLAALFASTWRALTTIVLQLLLGEYDPMSQLPSSALCCAAETPLLALSLTLACAPIVLLTWVGARLVGGRQSFKTHAHLTMVAFSVWVVLGALLAPLIILVPYLLSDDGRFALLFEELLPVFVGVIVGVAGIVWLTQAVRTAHRLSAPRAILVVLLVTALVGALLCALDRFTSGRFAQLVGMLVIFLLPWPG